MGKLANCPFCGGVATTRATGDYHEPDYVVECDKCNVGFRSSSGRGRAADKWNRRAPNADLKAMKNELCQLCGKYREAHNGACDGCKWHKWED